MSDHEPVVHAGSKVPMCCVEHQIAATSEGPQPYGGLHRHDPTECASCAALASATEPTLDADERDIRAELTLSPKFGAGIWLDRRLVARVVATIEDSHVTEDEPVPRWERDARELVEAANRGFAARLHERTEP